MTIKSGKKAIKIAGLIIAILAVLLTGFHFWFKAHARRMLEQLVQSRSNGKLKLSAGKFRFSYFSKKMELEDAVFYNTDTIQEPTSYRFAIKKINIKARAILPILFRNELSIDSLSISEPDIIVTRLRASGKKNQPDKEEVSIPEEMGKIYNSIQEALQVLQVKKFQLWNGRFTLLNKINPDLYPLVINNIDFHIENLQVDKYNEASKEKILFSDNVILRSKDQMIYFPDKKHRLGFKHFEINLKERLVYFDSCTIASTSADTSSTVFSVFSDKLFLSNIDFDTLYKSEIIKADSVYCLNPDFKLKVEFEKQKNNTPPPKLDDIVKQLTGDLVLGHVVVKGANFDIQTIRNDNPSSFVFRNNNFEIKGLYVDQSAKSPVSIESFAMAIRNYENFIKDSTYSIQFDSVLFRDDRIHLSNFVFQHFDKKGKARNTFRIPLFNLQGLSWDELLFDKHLKADYAILFNPDITYFGTSDSKGHKTDIVQSLSLINDYMDMQYLDIVDGKITLQLKDNLRITLDSATAAIESNTLLQSKGLTGIRNSLTRLFFKTGVITTGNLSVKLDQLRYTGESGRLEAGNVSVTAKNSDLNINLKNTFINQLVVDEKVVDLFASGVSWKEGSIKLNSYSGDATDKKEQLIRLHDIKGQNTNLAISLDNLAVTTTINNLAFDKLISTEKGIRELNGFSVDGKSLGLKNKGFFLSAGSYSIHDKAASALLNASLFLNNTSDSVKANIPAIKFVADIQAALNKKIILASLEIEKPVAFIQLAKTGIKNSGERKKFPATEIEHFSIKHPSIDFREVSDSGITYIKWKATDTSENIISLTGLNLGQTTALSVSAKDAVVNFSNAEFKKNKGRHFKTGNGVIKTTLRNLTFLQEPGLPADWGTTVTRLDISNFLLDSLGKNMATLHLEKAMLKELNIGSSSLLDIKKLAEKNSLLQITDLTGHYNNNISSINWHNMQFHRAGNSLTLDSFSIHPVLEKNAFIASQTIQKDYLAFRTGSVYLSGPQLDKLLHHDTLHIARGIINNAYLSSHRDKRLPPDTSYKPLFPGLLKKIPFRLAIDEMAIHKAAIEYSEFNPKTNSEDFVQLNDFTGHIRKITNHSFSHQDSLDISISAKLIDTVGLQLNMKQSYTDSLGAFSLNLQVQPADLRLLNPILKPLLSVEVVSGYLDTIHMAASGHEHFATGEMVMNYKNLKVKILTSQQGKKTLLGKLVNFIANTFVVKNKNTGKPGIVFAKRDKEKSAINYILKTSASGIMSSTGIKNNKKALRKHRKAESKK